MYRIYLTLLAFFMIGQSFSQTADNIIPTDSAVANPITSAQKEIIAIKINPGLNLYPNPAKNKITLQVKGFEPGIATVKIIDMKGNSMREDNRLLLSGNEDVMVYFMLQPGLYFMIVQQKNKLVKKKLLVI